MAYMTQQIVKPARLVMAILWPAFLMACVSSGVLFSLIDPLDLVIFGEKFNLSSQAGYTLGFLLFWVMGCVASTITVVLLLKPR
ncbi:hypothetical protein AAKU67_002298 [Oxalobacteraceae bacterium GrIS 2.11]